MTSTDHPASPPVDNTDARRVSAAKTVQFILSEIEFPDLIRASAWAVSGSHIQRQQALAMARIAGVDVETARRWLTEATTPKARDFWPVAFLAILSLLDVETQLAIAGAVLQLCGVQE